MNGLLALAFAAGMLAPINPCGVALLPAWFTYTIGDPDGSPVPVRLARSLRAGAALTLGFAGTLTAVGLAVSAGFRAVISVAPALGLAIGVTLVLVGMIMLGGRGLRLRLPAVKSTPTSRSSKPGRMVAFGAGYAAASLSCTLGVLLAVIAQAQATSTFAGLLAVFAAYAIGSATVLLLVAIGTAVAGAVLIRRVTAIARYGNRIIAVMLLITGAYLAWYWFPAAVGTGSRKNRVTSVATAAANWVQENTVGVTLLATAAVLIVVIGAAANRFRTRTKKSADSSTIP